MDARAAVYPRSIRSTLDAALADTPVVCLLGPRQSGKTTLARSLRGKRAYVSLDEEPLLAAARADPAAFVAGLPDPVILDEVQRAAELLPAIKIAVDHARRPGRFLLTGSANLLLLPQVSESLAGRMEVVQLHPLTESEKTRRAGQFLTRFLEGGLKPEIRSREPEPTPSLLERLLGGGYPEPLTRAPARARQWHRQYLRSLIERDVQDVARVRDARELGRLLEILSLRTAELLNITQLGNELDLRRETIDHYLAILERLYLIRRLPAWHRNEAKRLIKTPKVHLLDSGLAATLRGLTKDDWIGRRDAFGHLLESFVVQQIIAQAGWTDPDLRFWHYRDKDQVEVDLVITRGRQTWGVEVKASASVSPGDSQGLRRLAERCARDFAGGILLHSGTSTLATGIDRVVASPLSRLWDM